ITSASLNTRRKRSAHGRASSQKPELKAGWPQQVWPAGKSTSHPMRRRTFTVSTATSGCSWSTKHGTKSEILRAIGNRRDSSRTARAVPHPWGDLLFPVKPFASHITEELHMPESKPLDEKIQKALDKALYANGNPAAQKIRNFLNGTWLGEPLH